MENKLTNHLINNGQYIQCCVYFIKTNVHINMIYLTDAQNLPRENIPCEDKIKRENRKKKNRENDATLERRYIFSSPIH